MAFELMAQGAKPVELAMQSLWLTGRVLPTGAMLRVRHEFGVGGRQNVEAIYSFALPRDAALRRFQLRTGSSAAHSELRPTEEAMKEYERGIERGALSALARQYGDGVVNLSVGNIRPGETVVVDLEIVAGVALTDSGLRLRFPFTLAPSYHKQAIAVSPEPGWGGVELPVTQFGDMLLPKWAKDAKGLHRVGFDLALDLGLEVEKAGSPSHRIQVERQRVALASRGDVPDRDLVLDVETGAGVRVLSGGRQISAVIPSTEFGAMEAGPRAVVLLIDSSGSMAGAPFEQARSAALACVSSLEPMDRFGVVMFSDGATAWNGDLVAATKVNREAARDFLTGWKVGGGTELGPAIEAAARLLGASGGEVLLMTDGEVFGGEAVLGTARRAGIRLHTLGIGSASQDRMLTLMARETGGISRFVTAKERVDQSALELFSATGRPVAAGVAAEIRGTVTVPPAESVYRGSPAAFMGRLDEGAERSARLRWDGQQREYQAVDGGAEIEEALRLLEGARRITDLDCRLDAAVENRENRRIRNALRQLSEEYGLASREMSLVAVMERTGDLPGSVPQVMVVPVGLPEDMEMTMFMDRGLRHSLASPRVACESSRMTFSLSDATALFEPVMASEAHANPVVELAALLEDDGGMPGENAAERIGNSLLALAIFQAAGVGFAVHAGRVARFLKTQSLDEAEASRLKSIEAGELLPGDVHEAASLLLQRLQQKGAPEKASWLKSWFRT